MTTYEWILNEGKIANENLAIKNAIKVGLSEEMISKITTLPLEEVQKRIAELKS